MKLELSPVIRYWEYNSKEILSALHAVKERGADSVAAWVPWTQLETDRHHLLQKFVKQAAACGLRVKLGVTPELATGYPNGGIPDDLLQERQNLAQDRLGQNIFACAPPNIHPLVSLGSPAVFQRYGHFLLKFTQEMNDVFSEDFKGHIELVVTDSLFKHYRNIGLSELDHGDYSTRALHSGSSYRKEEWSPALAEKIFRARALDFLRSRFGRFKSVKVTFQNLFTRDISLSRLIEELSGASLNLGAVFSSMTRARSYAGLAWLDDLHTLSDRERNFLISSTLVTYGELWLSREDFLSFAPGFRQRIQQLIAGFSTPETEFIRPAIVLTQNRFAPARVGRILQSKLGAALKIKSSLAELSPKEIMETKLLAVEEGWPLEHKQVCDLIEIARRNDCTVALFRSALCELGRKEVARLETFRLSHGWTFEVAMFESGGHLLLIDGQEAANISMDALGDSMLAVSKLAPVCNFDRASRPIFSLGVDWNLKDGEKIGEMRTLFLMNPGANPENIDLEFARPARIHGVDAAGEAASEMSGRHFETILPPLSVVPITVIVEPEREIHQGGAVDYAGTTAELA